MRQRGKCHWCGEKVGRFYHVDHVVPLSKGGSNGPENLVIACAFCNISKHDRLPHEWSGSNGRLC
jgi:5-methylcytosine-specific restriction endonuclease McrA